MLSLAIQSTHQILLWHFQRLLSLRHNFYHFGFPQSSNLSLQVLILFLFFSFFFPYSYIIWYNNISDYPVSLFPVSYNYVRPSCLYHVVTLNIDTHNTFTSFWNLPEISLASISPLDVSDNFHCSILFSKKFLTLSAIPNNSIHSLIQLCETKSYALLLKITCGAFSCNLPTQSYQ